MAISVVMACLPFIMRVILACDISASLPSLYCEMPKGFKNSSRSTSPG